VTSIAHTIVQSRNPVLPAVEGFLAKFVGGPAWELWASMTGQEMWKCGHIVIPNNQPHNNVSALPRFLKVEEVTFSSTMVILLGKRGRVLARWEEIMLSQACSDKFPWFAGRAHPQSSRQGLVPLFFVHVARLRSSVVMR